MHNAAFSRNKSIAPTIASIGTICMLFVCLTTQMNSSIQSAQLWSSLYFVGITTVYSWAWGRNTQCWVFLHFLDKADIALLAGRLSWYWRIWFDGVQLKYNRGKEGICPEKVLSRSFCSLCVTGPRCYELQVWCLGWHWYILPCNQVSDSQQMLGCEMVDGNIIAHFGV